ncbi:unnamed protein product [[Actinomadura] parvosata subsp. kistnae]|uniref:DUF4245 domain-containing protein n=2 Tax=Nonomuraea TaxID=83681 RepID=A0A1V0A9V0_9ACTN|nr:hypothetical protein BKM31_40765 [Nonomuraea sp. ATCC 55076]SPL94896.1 unnamed protein product [Actinomadura parvosata subsp. kistnae]
MIPEGHHTGQGWRAALAVLALGATAFIIYALFSSGFGRLPRAAVPTPEPVLAEPEPEPESGPEPEPERPAGAGVGQPAPPRAPVLAVVAADFWLSYLPDGLARSGGEVTATGARARFGSAGGFAEVQVEHGTVAADWDGYRHRLTVLDARATTVRGRPAVAGRYPGGGRVLAWLERPGTGALVRVSDSFGRELAAIAASVKAPVGD